MAPPLPRKLTLVPLIAATYFMVSGGPFGLEGMVSKAGYGGAILILLITPAIWSLPTALMVSELSTAIPEDGGYYVWVRRGLGPFWGFQEAWLSLAGSFFDMALYPALFVEYLGHFAPSITAGPRGFWLKLAMVAASALWNLLGVRAVGRSSIWLAILLLAPFTALSGYAMLHPAATAAHAQVRQVDLLAALVLAMWNYMGFDYGSTVAGEVERPQRTYPLAMTWSVGLISLNYVIPVGAVALTGLDPNRWTTGGWADVARAIVPGALAGVLAAGITFSGVITAIGTENAQVMAYSRLPVALAEDGYLPRILARRLKNGAPWVAIVACSAVWACSVGLSFEKLLLLDVLLTGLSMLLEFAALVGLRVREPDLPRPYRVPGGLAGAIGLGVAPAVLIALAAKRNLAEPMGRLNALQIGAILILSGVLAYFVLERIRKHDHR